MTDIRKILNIVAESSAGASTAGAVASVSSSFTSTQSRVQETTKAPNVLEYGNWENSAVSTSNKLKKSREKSAKVVKSIYGDDKQSTTSQQVSESARSWMKQCRQQYGSDVRFFANSDSANESILAKKNGKIVESFNGNLNHISTSEQSIAEGKTGPGLWANIHAKRERIKSGSGERMRKPGSKGAPTAANFKAAASESVAEEFDSEALADEIYNAFESMYPNLAMRADQRVVHDAIIDVLNYGGGDPGALAQDVARAVKRSMQGVTEGKDGQKTFTVVCYSPKTDRNVTKTIKAASESEIWDKLKAKDIQVVSVKEQGVTEGSLNESPSYDTIRGLITEFNKQMSGSPYYPLDYKSPGMRMWTRGDGSKYKDPGYIFIERDLKPEDQPKWREAGAVEKFWKFLESKGARKIGDVSGEFGSSPHSPAVVLNKIVFVIDGNSIAWGSTSRLKNTSVWRQKQQGVSEGAPIVVMPMAGHFPGQKKKQSEIPQMKGLSPYREGVAAAKAGEPYNNPYPFNKALGAPGNYDHNSYREGYQSVKGVAESSEIKIPTDDGITMQDIRLIAGEGKLTKKTVLQAIAVIRKQRKEREVAEGGVLKSIKRGLQGWDKNAVGPSGEKLGDPKDIVRRNKAHDDETLKGLHKAASGKGPGFPFNHGTIDPKGHGPASLQKRVLDREMRKRGLGEEGVAEGSLEEYGDTKKGQKILTKVHKRAVGRAIKAADQGDAQSAKKNQDTANRAWERFGPSFGGGVAEAKFEYKPYLSSDITDPEEYKRWRDQREIESVFGDTPQHIRRARGGMYKKSIATPRQWKMLFDLTDDQGRFLPRMSKGHAAGVADKKAGKDINSNPFTPGSDEHKDWVGGWKSINETNDYFRRREREEGIISGQKPARKKQPAQTSDYTKRREKENKKSSIGQGIEEGQKAKASEYAEDYDPNGPPPGPEFKPTMPKGTVRVDVSDVYDWYKLGKNISDLDRADPSMFGKGPPSTIMAFGSEDEEHNYINQLDKLGLTTTDIDPVDPNQPKGMKRQKVDPTYNVQETSRRIDELSTEKLAQYKKAAGASASAADKQGDFKKGDKRFKGIVKATLKQFANDEKKSKTDEKLDENDVIINPFAIEKRTGDLISKMSGHADHEVQMAKGDLVQAGKNAVDIYQHIRDVSEEEGLEGWVQEKITKATDYLNIVRDYFDSKQIESIDGVSPGTHMFTSESVEGKDKNAMNIPFLIRALEYARDNAKDDLDLHIVVEHMIDASLKGKTLSMNDYVGIFKNKIR